MDEVNASISQVLTNILKITIMNTAPTKPRARATKKIPNGMQGNQVQISLAMPPTLLKNTTIAANKLSISRAAFMRNKQLLEQLHWKIFKFYLIKGNINDRYN